MGEHGYDFIEACCSTEIVEIYNHFPIQAIINRHWTYVKFYILTLYLVPFMI
jgi:hypothetical protein